MHPLGHAGYNPIEAGHRVVPCAVGCMEWSILCGECGPFVDFIQSRAQGDTHDRTCSPLGLGLSPAESKRRFSHPQG